MADKGASGAGGCNTTCGCDVPCPGGVGCSDKCTLSGTERSGYDHKICSCGEHCSCNPCTCAKTEASGTGRAHCKCGAGCACATCAA